MPQNAPYTHADFSQAPASRRAFVQVKKNNVTFCAHIVDAVTTADGVDLWMVETSIGTLWTTPKNTRACGDTRCVCITTVSALVKAMQ